MYARSNRQQGWVAICRFIRGQAGLYQFLIQGAQRAAVRTVSKDLTIGQGFVDSVGNHFQRIAGVLTVLIKSITGQKTAHG